MTQKPIRFDYRSISEMRQAAEEVLPKTVHTYISDGAASGATAKRNNSAFAKWSLLPKRLSGVVHPSTETTVFGQKYAVPFGAAPVGMQQLFHPDGEKATALACHFHAAPCILSTVSNVSYAQASETCKVKPWFQLYPTSNFEVTKQLLANAVSAGAEVIVLTVDVPVLGKRRFNARGLLKHPDYKHLQFGNLHNLLKVEDEIHTPSLNWDMLSLIKETTDCKLVVKGILHPDDATECLRRGVDGILISNHGGRQMDSNYSSIEALAAIKPLLPKDFPVFLDGGIRSATDIMKALFLGAKMVFLGRPICYGLAIGGQAGLDHLIQLLKTDLIRNMQLMGIADLNTLAPSQLLRTDISI